MAAATLASVVGTADGEADSAPDAPESDGRVGVVVEETLIE